MTTEILFPLATFAFVTSITPGPNNIMLMTSGVNFGFRRTIPHMLGIGIGFMAMLIGVGAGLAGLFQAVPALDDGLRIVCLVYISWMAWRIAARPTQPLRDPSGSARPLTFWQAAVFQWVNPKAWAMALSAMTLYAPDNTMAAILVVAILFGVINLPAVSSWTILGMVVAQFLARPGRLRAFNVIMAVMLMASIFPVILL